MVLGGVVMYTRKNCEKHDIWLIRDFLKETYKVFGKKVNWHIDRLNFTYSMSRVMNEVSEEEYRNRIVLYFKENRLRAVLLTEGEDRGEAFFQVDSYDLDDELVTMMFDDVDTMSLDLNRDIFLRIAHDNNILIEEASKRSYELMDWSEITMKKELNEALDDQLPQGFSYSRVDSKRKAEGHGKAFGYFDKKDVLKNAEKGLDVLMTMDDYRINHDINVVNDSGEVVAFATIWYDDKNKLGILEPVGTHPDYRKRGLAKKAIYRGCNEIIKYGANCVYVGSEQEFYKRIGFNYTSEDKVYKKSIKSQRP